MGLFNRFFNKSADKKDATTTTKGKRMSADVNKPQPDRVTMQMSVLRDALDEAEDTSNPSWEKLHLIYKNAIKDGQVITQVTTAINKLQASPFVVDIDKAENEDLTKLFQRPWFAEFLAAIFDAEMWGYTVVEFGQQDEHGEFLGCKVFPRTNIYPFNRNIIVESTDTSGIEIGDNPSALFLFEMGETDDLGLLESVSREVILKAFARGDWAKNNKKWGMPRILVGTESDDDAEIDKKEQAAANFARNGYMIHDINDEIETLEDSSAGSGHLIYKDNVELCNKEISKLINGQTGTADEKAFVGSAQVHENILDDYHASRLRRIGNVINFQLFPFLRFHNYQIPDNAKFRFPELDPKTAAEKDDAIVDDPDGDGKKKSPVNRLPWGKS